VGVKLGCHSGGRTWTEGVFVYTRDHQGVWLHVNRETVELQYKQLGCVCVFPYIRGGRGCVGEICGVERDDVTGIWRKQRRGELQILCCSPDILLWWSSQERWGGWGMWYFFGGRIETYAEFWSGILEEGDRF
jgi:hypothetical protein